MTRDELKARVSLDVPFPAIFINGMTFVLNLSVQDRDPVRLAFTAHRAACVQSIDDLIDLFPDIPAIVESSLSNEK